MLQAVEDVCLQYRHVWNQLPAFREAFGCYQKQLQSLTALATSQRRHTGGAAQDKVRAREELCVVAYEIAAAVRASALVAGDGKAAGKLGFSLTQLRIGKDQLCLERCRQILEVVQNAQTTLEGYGVTQRRIAELASLLDAFNSAAEQTRKLRSANKSLTSQLPNAFNAIDQTLYNLLDNLVPQFRTTAPRFYNQYQENRVMRPAVEQSSNIPVTETEEPQLLD